MNALKCSLITLTLLAASTAVADEKSSYHSEVDVKQKPDGQYEASSKTEHTDASGTKVVEKQSDELKKTITGAAKSTHSSETTTDPKGLGNKTKSTAESTVKVDKDGEATSTAKSHSVDAAGTAHTLKTSKEVDIKRDGTKEITTQQKEVTDPKGLGNKAVVKNETVTKEHPDGTVTTEVN